MDNRGLLDISGSSVLRVEMNHPPANVLSERMLSELSSILAEASENDDVRVIVLAASGSIFCAGHDLKELTSHRSDSDSGREYFRHLLSECASLMCSIVTHPKPVIAEVGGLATAAGCQLVSSCDLAVASSSATFCTPGVHIGLFCSTPMVALSRSVHRKHAMDMLLTGDTINSSRALEIGLVNRVVPDSDLTTESQKYAEKIASKPPYTLRVGKRAFYEQLEVGLFEAYNHACSVMVENMLHKEAIENIGSFLDKSDKSD